MKCSMDGLGPIEKTEIFVIDQPFRWRVRPCDQTLDARWYGVLFNEGVLDVATVPAVNPIHFLWSYVLILWWIFLLCIFGSIRRHVHISNPVSSYSIHNIYLQLHVTPLTERVLLQDHIPRLLLSWTNTLALDFLGMTLK